MILGLTLVVLFGMVYLVLFKEHMMFWNKKTSIITTIPKEEKKKNLLDRDIFSAKEALQMGVEAREKKRNDNRMAIFRQIKQQISYGHLSTNFQIYLFDDGNEIYFEGLGYKVQKVWYHPVTGAELYEQPTIESLQATAPQYNSTIDNGSGLGYGGGISSGFALAQQYRLSVPQPYMKVSWEK